MARFFVNRGGGRAPEGPFEEEYVVRLIIAGRLKSGYAGVEGSQRFRPLASHPAFARALAQVGQTPHADVPLPTRNAAPSRMPTSRGTLLAAVVAFFVLALGAVGVGTYVMFSTGGMPARAALPSDTEFLFEITSVPRFTSDLSASHVLDPQKFSAKQALDELAGDLSASFGVPKTTSAALILAADSIGVGARKLASIPEGGVVLTFTASTPLNTFFSSERFKYTALIGSNGRRYQLAARAPLATSEPSAGALGRTFASLSLDAKSNVLVWFETSKVLFFGSAAFASAVSRALSLDAPSLETNPQFQRAERNFGSKPDAVAYLDPAQLATLGKLGAHDFFNGEMAKAQLAVANFGFVPAGLVGHFVTRFEPIANSNPAPALPLAQALTISDQLPTETFAYVAAVTKSSLSGSDLRRLLLEQVVKAEPAVAAELTDSLARLDQPSSQGFDELLGSVGDQAALALLAPSNYSLALGNPQQMAAKFAIVYLQAVKEQAPARALAEELKTQFGSLLGQAQLREDASGYSLLPKDDGLGVSAQLRFVKGYLCLAFGNTSLVERSLHALSTGEGTLAGDPAVQAARAALPNPAQLFGWVDVGRIVHIAQQNPLLAGRMHDAWLDQDGVRWTGPERVTTAFGVRAERDKDSLTVRVETLNLPEFAAILAPAWEL
jgi:hypothetical protein